MNSVLRKYASIIFGLVLIAAVGWGTYEIVTVAFHAFTSLDTKVAVTILAGSMTVLASTVTIVVSRHYQVKQEQEIAHRDKKIELYDSFLKKLFEMFFEHNGGDPHDEDLVPFLRENQRKILLWSGPKAIKAYASWHREISKPPPRATQVIKTIDLFFALREDLGHSNKGVDHSELVRFILRNSDLFMQEYRKNPNVTMAEIAILEKRLGLSSDSENRPTTGSA
jgi:hypothetical protein